MGVDTPRLQLRTLASLPSETDIVISYARTAAKCGAKFTPTTKDTQFDTEVHWCYAMHPVPPAFPAVSTLHPCPRPTVRSLNHSFQYSNHLAR